MIAPSVPHMSINRTDTRQGARPLLSTWSVQAAEWVSTSSMDPHFPSFPARVTHLPCWVNILLCPEATTDGSPQKTVDFPSGFPSPSSVYMWSDPDPAPLGECLPRLPSSQAPLPHCCGCIAICPAHNRHPPKMSSVLSACQEGFHSSLAHLQFICMVQGHRSLLVKGNHNILWPFLEFSF